MFLSITRGSVTPYTTEDFFKGPKLSGNSSSLAYLVRSGGLAMPIPVQLVDWKSPRLCYRKSRRATRLMSVGNFNAEQRMQWNRWMNTRAFSWTTILIQRQYM